MQKALELIKNPNTYDKKPATILTANIISQMLPQQ